MFTGIIEAVGRVNSLAVGAESGRVSISASLPDNQLKIGDSVAINGVCLTVTSRNGDQFTADIGRETLKVTNLGGLKAGSSVNVERPLRLGSRLDGHLVQGHVDGIGKILNINKLGGGFEVTLEASSDLLRYIVRRGSVTINGISLTCTDYDERGFKVFLIPHTIEVTTFKSAREGDTVNLEIDIIGKYVEKLSGSVSDGVDTEKQSNISEEFLKDHGF